jgi:outer membrane protein TolC
MNDIPTRAARRAMIRSTALLLAVMTPALTSAAQQPTPATANTTTTAPRALSLDEAIRLATRESEVLQIARAAVTRANGQQLQARSLYLPQVNSSLAYNRTLRSQFSALAGTADTTTLAQPTFEAVCAPHIDPTATPAQRDAALQQARTCAAQQGIDFSKVGFGAKNQYTFGLSVTQSVFSGGRNEGQNTAANATRRTADIDVTSQRAQLALDVTEAYFNAQLADRLVEIADTTLAQTEELLRQTQVSRRVGNTSEYELLRATVTRDNQRPLAIQRRGDRDVAYLRLKQMLNMPLDEPLALTTPIDEPEAVSRVVAANARGAEVVDTLAPPPLPTPDTTTSLRAPVRESAEVVRAQEGLLQVARSDRLPTFSLNTSYQRLFFPATFLPTLSQYSENWTVGGTIAMSLFSGGRVTGQVDVAKANLDEARARLKQATELAALDTRVALNLLTSAEAAFSASRGTADLARRAYSIDQLRYREGISTQNDLTQSRLMLEQALANRALSARDVAVARARMALIRDLPINTTALGAATQRAITPQQQPQLALPQRVQSATTAIQAGALQIGVPTP